MSTIWYQFFSPWHTFVVQKTLMKWNIKCLQTFSDRVLTCINAALAWSTLRKKTYPAWNNSLKYISVEEVGRNASTIRTVLVYILTESGEPKTKGRFNKLDHWNNRYKVDK